MAAFRACVFGSSSNKTPKNYLDASYELGKVLAERGHCIVTGGGAFGCMIGVQNGCRENGGDCLGIIHEKFVDGGDGDMKHLKDMIITRGDDLEERKRLLIDNGDCLLVCPGGVGTYDEFWDVVSHKSLSMKNLSRKPIVILNTAGFYDGFIMQLQRAFDDGLLYNKVEDYFYVAKTPLEAVQWTEKYLEKVQIKGSTSMAKERISRVSDSKIVASTISSIYDSVGLTIVPKILSLLGASDEDKKVQKLVFESTLLGCASGAVICAAALFLKQKYKY